MSREIIVDVDLTVAKSDISWLGYLQSRYDFKDNTIALQFFKDRDNECLDYNLSKYFDLRGDDPMKFWKRSNLYKYVQPLPSCKRVLDYLKGKGDKIYFVSHAKTEHNKSKWDWINTHFPWVRNSSDAAYIVTRNKNAVKGSVIIDDRNLFLNMHDAKVKIKINTPYTQDEELTRPVFSVDSWDEIINLLEV